MLNILEILQRNQERGSSWKSHEINAAKNQLQCKALSTRIVFESFLSVRTKTLKQRKYDGTPCRACALWCMTSSWLDNFRFCPSAWKRSAVVFQKTPRWGPFSKTCVSGARKRRWRADTRLKRRKKISVFKNIRIRVDEAGVLGSSNSIIHFPRLRLANLSVSRKVRFQPCFHDYV